MTNRGYKILRMARMAVAAVVAVLITVAVAAGYACVFSRMQIVPALLSCSGLWLLLWFGVTALFGRVYCSTVCPMGTLQDVFARIFHRRRGYFYTAALPGLRWGFVGVALVAAVLGFSIVVGLLDPYSSYARMVAYLGVLPVDLLREAIGHPAARAATVSVASMLIALLTLVVVAVFAVRRGRLLCNTLCPVGTLLGALSRYSLYHVDIDTDKCLGCGRCTALCRSSCINPADHTVDLSRCVVCLDCVASCPNSAITIRRGRHRLRMPMLEAVGGSAGQTACSASSGADVKPIDRRAFFAAVFAAAAMSPQAFARGNAALRPLNYAIPPGALSRDSFMARCTGCGACSAACETGVIRPSNGEFGLRNALHPVMDFDSGPCRYDCVACTHVCPTGALQPLTPGEKHRTVIGKARIEPDLCLMYADKAPCGICARRCPAAAITIMPLSDGRRLPAIDFDSCIGCGECRWVCPTRPKAIVIEGE